MAGHVENFVEYAFRSFALQTLHLFLKVCPPGRGAIFQAKAVGELLKPSIQPVVGSQLKQLRISDSIEVFWDSAGLIILNEKAREGLGPNRR